MSLNPVSVNIEPRNIPAPQKDSNPSFKGAGMNPIVAVMDSVGRGGYIAEFMAQDFCGFIAPRITTGLNRNREETHEYNWKFAATEAIREFLSGPSMAAIPALMLWGVKKYSGTANNVPISHISGIGNNFAEFVSQQKNISDTKALRHSYYESVMKNVLKNATENQLGEAELSQKAKDYADRIIKSEAAKSKGTLNKIANRKVAGSSEDIIGELHDEFTTLRKQYSGSKTDVLNLSFSTKTNEGKALNIGGRFDKFTKHLKNYMDDAIKNIEKVGVKETNIVESLHNFNAKRISSRFKLNLGMNLAVGAFLCFVPKMYKHKDGNPGLAGLIDPEDALALEEANEAGKEDV